MLSADELRELRSLQARAYGRDAGISDADARRLRELEQQRMPASGPRQAVSPVPARSTTGDEEVLLSRIPDEVLSPRRVQEQRLDEGGPHPASDAPATTDVTSTAADASVRGTLRRFWRPVAAASAVLLVLGLAAGWAIFGQRPGGIALTDDQVQRRLELYETGGYDEGSLRAVGQQKDVLVWYATQSDGKFVCIILDVADQSADTCQVEQEVREGAISTNVMRAATDPDSGQESHVGAFILYSTTGEPVAAIQRWQASPNEDWLAQFDVEERERAEGLVEEGFEPGGMTIVGYFQEEAVWVATRRTDQSLTESCLIIGAASGSSECKNDMSAFNEGLSASVIVDGSAWALDVRYTKWQTPYLTITGGVGVTHVTIEEGDRVEVGGEHGDPIEIGTDVPQG